MRKKDEQNLFILSIIVAIIYGIFKIIKTALLGVLDFLNYIKIPAIILLITVLIIYIIYEIFLYLYFKSKKFEEIKNSINQHIINCNELNNYTEELKYSYLNLEYSEVGESQMIDNSKYSFKRKEWNNNKSKQTYHCSATICKNANNNPIKYLCKYFNIQKNEQSLSDFENVLNNFTSIEQGKSLLKKERERILKSISKSVPDIISLFSEKRLISELGFEKINFSNSYIPIFNFEYVSAGGNSSTKCEIKLDIENLNKLLNYLNSIIKWRKSIAGQRALMTSPLREKIKKRDNYRCCNCNLGIVDEKNLLLEIDHIIPVSKGGLTTEKNLQTLCWKCNRKKGTKIITVYNKELS